MVPDILKKIIAYKADEIDQRIRQVSLKEVSELAENADSVRGFVQAIRERLKEKQTAVIAELKKASPSKGVLREQFDPIEIARTYADHGATCLSVLTDGPSFQGSDKYLKQARAACELPVLRKDFMIETYQVYESRAMGADCILLIVAVLDETRLKELGELAHDLGMDVLVEVHDQQELDRALCLPFPLIGINNRDLISFETSLDTTLNLLKKIPEDKIVVTESGIHSSDDVKLMRDHNVNTFLVGEVFMRADDPGKKLSELFD